MAAVDLRDSDYLGKLADELNKQNAEVTFANFTNVWEHAGSGLAESLPRLPFHSSAVILHSSRAYTKKLYPRMMGVCRGLETYIENAGSAYNLWIYYMRLKEKFSKNLSRQTERNSEFR